MSNDNTKQVCTNCKYFLRYYIISRGKLCPIHKGHCVHLKIDRRVKTRHVQRDEGCELWQPYELQKLECQYNIKLKLEQISKDVEGMLQVLRDAE